MCGDVSFSADYIGNRLSISNTGNVPIFRVNVKVKEPGSHNTYDIKDDLDASWPDWGLNQGGAFTSQDISSYVGSADSLVLIPVLIGTSDKGEKSFTCDEKDSLEIFIY